MEKKLRQQLQETIRRHGMISAGDRVGVAVSGGADSVALLLLLDELRSSLGISLVVLHLNHLLRGAESDADERFVVELARVRGLDCISASENVAAVARRESWNLEDAARRLRYAFFERTVRDGRATRVAVAHTADDQAETVLGRLIRGTGTTGLAGILPILGSVVRPLLDVRRQDLRNYLARRDQAWREDETNGDTRRLRARLRHRLIPLLEREYSPAIVERLAELARLANDEETLWVALAEQRFRSHVKETRQGLALRIQDLFLPLKAPAEGLAQPDESTRAIARRLIRRVIAQLHKKAVETSAAHIEQVLHLATKSSSGHRVLLPGRVVVERSFDQLIFSLARSAGRPSETLGISSESNSYEYPVGLPERGAATISVPELGKRFSLKLIDWSQAPRDTKRESEALDAGLLRAPLVLRNWRPGDAYQPRGRRAARKVKDFLQASRVALPQRAGWPVLTCGGELVWVLGMPPAEGFGVNERTRVGLLIAEEGMKAE
ncbi:MAG TPA: tRNA lysidine(34) synthetase TilS [Candidatus Acidoferrales bacterium]|jgi:tRNA(Ile)-lysidine synthase|nr:tRNA lysidine(34) synthetase TilS [Candidatus Acidoferrales bacterium]